VSVAGNPRLLDSGDPSALSRRWATPSGGSYANANGVGYPKGCVATRERFAQQLGKRNVVREAAKGSSVFMGPGELQRPSVSEFPGALRAECDGSQRQRCPDAHPDKQWLRRECP